MKRVFLMAILLVGLFLTAAPASPPVVDHFQGTQYVMPVVDQPDIIISGPQCPLNYEGYARAAPLDVGVEKPAFNYEIERNSVFASPGQAVLLSDQIRQILCASGSYGFTWQNCKSGYTLLQPNRIKGVKNFRLDIGESCGNYKFS
jgi:hypothetical protein